MITTSAMGNGGLHPSNCAALAAKAHVLKQPHHRTFERDCSSPSASSVATVESDHSISTTGGLSVDSSGSPVSDSDCLPTEGIVEIIKEMNKANNERYDKYFTIGIGVRFLRSKKDFNIGVCVNRNFIDSIVQIFQSHLELSYFSNLKSMNDLKLTIRSIYYVIISVVKKDILTTVLFSNRTELLSQPSVRLIPRYFGQMQSLPYTHYFKYKFGYNPLITSSHSYHYPGAVIAKNNFEIASSESSTSYNSSNQHHHHSANNSEDQLFVSSNMLSHSHYSNQDKKSLVSQTTTSSIMTQQSSSLMSSSQCPLSGITTTSESSIGYKPKAKIDYNIFQSDHHIFQCPTIVQTTN